MCDVSPRVGFKKLLFLHNWHLRSNSQQVLGSVALVACLSVTSTLNIPQAIASDGDYVPTVAPAIPTAATQKMLLDRHNDPTFGSESNQGFGATTLLSDADTQKYHAIMASVQKVFGAYRNWNAVVFDPQGYDLENADVFDVFIEIGYRNDDEEIKANGWTTEKGREYSSCLTGSAPNGGVEEAGGNYVEHSLCILWLSSFIQEQDYFEQWPPLPPGEYYHQWLIDAGLIGSLYHEYFHHYQKAHTLDRVFGYDNADFNHPEQNAYIPWWWLEGAGQFEFWFMRDHWKSQDHLKYLDPDSTSYEGYWDTVDWSIPPPNSGSNYSSLDEHIEWAIDQLNSTFFFAASQVQNTPNKIGGVLNASTDGENCEGWLAGPSDGWYQGDPRRGEGFESLCPNIIFAAGTQFIAHKSSWQVALRDIPADYYELSFWGAIEKHLGLTELEFYAEFNALLRSVDANTIDETYAPPGWKIPEGDIAEVVDFLGISYYGEPTVPRPPLIISTDYGDQEIVLTVSVADTGNTTLKHYKATCTDGTNSYTGTNTSSPIIVSGLTNGVAYTCTVTATNSANLTSASSTATAPIIPEELIPGMPIWLLYQAGQ